MAVQTLIQVRRGSLAEWNAANSVPGEGILYQGEMGYETDTRRFKIGDGSTPWSSLSYAAVIPTGFLAGSGICLTPGSNGSTITISLCDPTIQVADITDFDEGVDGRVSSLLQAGSNISLSYDDSANTLTINSTLGTAEVQEAIGTYLIGGSGIAVSYNSDTGYTTVSLSGDPPIQLADITDLSSDAETFLLTPSSNNLRTLVTDETGSGNLVFADSPALSGIVTITGDLTVSGSGLVSANVNDFNSSVSGLLPSIGGGSGISVNFDSNIYTIALSDPTIQSTDITDFIEAVQDVVGSGAGTTGFLRNGSGINAIYNDEDNTLTIGVTGIPSSLITDFSDAVSDTVDTTLSAGTGISLNYDSNTNTLTVNTSGLAYAQHPHNWADITDAASTVTLTELGYLSGVVPGTASANKTVVTDENKNITGLGNITTTGNVTVGGNLNVLGSSTVVNSTTVDIGDNIIKVNVSGAETQGGFEVYDHDSSISQSIVWDIVNNRWEFTGGNVYTTGNFISQSLQVSSTELVSNLNADLLDGQHGSYYRNFGNLSGLPSPIITTNVTGAVTGFATVTLTELSGGTLNITTALSDNTVTSAKIVDGTIVNADINDNAAIAVTKLASSGVTLGNTTINLGESSTVIDGLTRISGVNASNPVRIYYAVIDGGTP